MGVGMVQFDQHLISSLEARLGKWRVDVEDGERLLARRGDARDRIGAVASLLLAALRALAVVEAERVGDTRFVGRAMALAKLPARPLPHRVAADFGLDLAFAHPGIVIPGGVV